MLRALACRIAPLALVLVGCVVAPADQTLLDSRSQDVFFQGYGTNPASTIVLKARNYATGQMEEFARTTTQTKAQFAENTFGQHPALYYWTVTAKVAPTVAQNGRWQLRACQDTQPTPVPGSGLGSTGSNLCIQRFDAEVVISEPTGQLQELWTFPEGGVSCVVDKLNQGQPLIESSIGCSTRGALLRLQSQ